MEAVDKIEKHVLTVFIEFAENIVEKKHGRFAYLVTVDDDLSYLHRKRDRALLSLRRKLASVLVVYLDFDVVAMRAYGGKAEFLVLGA